MTGLAAVAVLLMGTWGCGTALRLRFVHALPTTVLGVMFTLYLAYIAGVLHAAWWFVVVACVAGGLFGMVRLRRRDTSLLALRPAAPLMAFLVALALVMFFTRGRVVSGHDELRLWGAYPKLLYVDGGLQVGPGSLLMGEMQTYTPGLPLLGHFFAAFNTDFVDQRVFLAYGVFATALLAPLASRVSWQRPAWIVPAGVGMALLPLAYANYLTEAGGDFYASLFADPVVGLVLGYLLWLTATGAVRRTSWRWQVGLAAAVLYLVKASGVALGCVVLAVGVVRWLRATQGESWRHRLAGVAALAAPLALAYATWAVIQTRLGPPSKFDTDQLSAGFDPGIAKEFTLILLGRPEFGPGLGIFRDYTTFAVLNTLTLVAIFCLAVAHRGRRRRFVVWAFAGLLVCQILFLAGMYFLVVGPFGGEFLSYPRYSATMLTAASTLLALLVSTQGLPRRDWMGTMAALVLSACLVFLVLCFPLRKPISYVGGWETQSAVDAQKVETALARNDYPEKNPVVALVYRDDWLSHVGHHHGVYYQLIGTGAQVDLQLPATLTPTDNAEYERDAASARSDFTEYLVDNEVRLLVVAEENPELAAQLVDWFDRPPELDSVYEVVIDGDLVQLRWVS